MTAPFSSPALAALHARFLDLVPGIEEHGRIYFRHVKCPDRKADALREMVAIGWKWFVRLVEQGKRAEDFPVVFTTLLGRAVRCGRKLAGMDRANDILSPRAQRTHGFTVAKLPDISTLDGTPLDEALHDNTQTPVPDQVSFRCDFPAWRLTQTERDRRVIDDLMQGERTLHVARKHGVSPARVSQLRREFQLDWDLFTADTALTAMAIAV